MSSPLPKRNVKPLVIAEYHVERTSSATFKLYKGAALIGGAYRTSQGWRAFVHRIGKRHGHFHETLEAAVGARWKAPIVALFTAAQETPVVTFERFLEASKRLAYHVECQPMGQYFFEPIAAFNHEGVAKSYAATCKEVNREHLYRVVPYDGLIEAMKG